MTRAHISIALFLGTIFLVIGSLSAADREFLRWAGKNPIIDSIQIEGNHHFAASAIKKQMYSRERGLFQVLGGDRRSRIQKETLQRDTLEIKYMYYLEGYLGAVVKETIERLSPSDHAQIRVVIDEGRQFRYGAKEVTGTFPDSMRGNLVRISSRLKLGTFMNPLEIHAAVFEMKAYLANSGFPYATVEYALDTGGTTQISPVRFSVISDSLVHFGKLTIEGANKFPEYCARREVKRREGALYRRDDILDSQRRLFGSGYYSTFQLRQSSESADRLRPDFTLALRERKTAAVTLNGGVGQSPVRDLEIDGSAGFLKRNFLGSRRYELGANYALGLGGVSRLIKHSYHVSFTEPWFLGLRMPLTIATTWEPKLKDPVQDFRRSALSLSAETNTKFGQYIWAALGFEYVGVNLTNLTGNIADSLGGSTNSASRRGLTFSFRRDSRDSIFNPRRGSLFRINTKYYGGFLGGDGNFVKIQSDWSSYQVVWPGWISATRFKGGWAHQYGSPRFTFVDEAQYLGGANTVRGFAENQLGPKDAFGKPIGAEYIIVVNQEFRWRTIQLLGQIPGLRRWPLWQSVFIDMGNGYNSDKDISFRSMAYSYGTGLQIMSPAGPVRLDYARVIPHDNFSFADRWHFTILYAF